MTRDKASKRAVRARMTKTGERYTTARYQIRNQQREAPPTDPQVTALDGAASASRTTDLGMSDDAILRGTGKRWDDWLRLLDTWDAAPRPHAEIAQYISAEYGVSGWWAQTVTVGYERARGLRAMHQRPDGFSVSVSRTFPIAISRLYAAFVEDSARDAWLEPGSIVLRTARPNRSARFDVVANDSRLAVYFIEKSETKSTAQLQHERLASADEVAVWRGVWKMRLHRLGAILAEAD